jgi:hypothetical protein
MINTYISDPVPGFMDHAGNLINEGDWVMVGVGGRSSYGPRLARILSIEPAIGQKHVGYAPIPEEEWSDWDRRRNGYGNAPTRPVYEPYTYAKVKVAQYPDMGADTKPIRRELTISQCLKYGGLIPFDLA